MLCVNQEDAVQIPDGRRELGCELPAEVSVMYKNPKT